MPCAHSCQRKALFTSRVSGRGNIFYDVRVCVCLLVCLRSSGWTVGPTDLKFSTHIKDPQISDKFEGQGHQGPQGWKYSDNYRYLISHFFSNSQDHSWDQCKSAKKTFMGKGWLRSLKCIWLEIWCFKCSKCERFRGRCNISIFNILSTKNGWPLTNTLEHDASTLAWTTVIFLCAIITPECCFCMMIMETDRFYRHFCEL